MDKMQPISQALYSLLFLGYMGAGFPLYVQGQNVDELPPDSIYNIGYARGSLKNLKSATTRLYDTEAKIICIVSKKGPQSLPRFSQHG